MSLTYTHSISIFQLKRWGYLERGKAFLGETGWVGGGRIHISVEVDNNPVTFVHALVPNPKSKADFKFNKVKIWRTACHFGGLRHWFICPRCNHTAGVLYVMQVFDPIMICRRCTGYNYSSQTSDFGRSLAYRARELEWLERRKYMRTKYYKGKMTRRYGRYLEVVGQAEEDRYVKIEQLLKS